MGEDEGKEKKMGCGGIGGRAKKESEVFFTILFPGAKDKDTKGRDWGKMEVRRRKKGFKEGGCRSGQERNRNLLSKNSFFMKPKKKTKKEGLVADGGKEKKQGPNLGWGDRSSMLFYFRYFLGGFFKSFHVPKTNTLREGLGEDGGKEKKKTSSMEG